jgi:hypothetical protein
VNVVTSPTYPKREDYEPVIHNFMPGVGGDELELRSSLLLMRDRAMSTKPFACEEAWQILDLVERTAGRDAFRSMAVNELAEIKRLLIRLVSTASGFDSLFGSQFDGVKVDGRG